MTTAAGPDLLSTIVAATRRIVAERSAKVPLDALERRVWRTPAGAAFTKALRNGTTPRVIAECKRRSPSRGILRNEYEPATHARAYADAGAAAISVLTEPTFFDGAPSHLRAVRDAVDVPLLRKDFIVSEYQLAEATVLGADAVLLIVSALTDSELKQLIAQAQARQLACLVEVHGVEEIDRAVDAGATIIGVNSRNLRTLGVDREVLNRAASMLPSSALAVAESGIRTREDIDRLTEAGYHAFLVGERLIAQPDPGEALKELRRASA